MASFRVLRVLCVIGQGCRPTHASFNDTVILETCFTLFFLSLFSELEHIFTINSHLFAANVAINWSVEGWGLEGSSFPTIQTHLSPEEGGVEPS